MNHLLDDVYRMLRYAANDPGVKFIFIREGKLVIREDAGSYVDAAVTLMEQGLFAEGYGYDSEERVYTFTYSPTYE